MWVEERSDGEREGVEGGGVGAAWRGGGRLVRKGERGGRSRGSVRVRHVVFEKGSDLPEVERIEEASPGILQQSGIHASRQNYTTHHQRIPPPLSPKPHTTPPTSPRTPQTPHTPPRKHTPSPSPPTQQPSTSRPPPPSPNDPPTSHTPPSPSHNPHTPPHTHPYTPP